MRFYNQQHEFYCGINLHARKIYKGIVSNKSRNLVPKNIKTEPQALFELVFPYLGILSRLTMNKSAACPLDPLILEVLIYLFRIFLRTNRTPTNNNMNTIIAGNKYATTIIVPEMPSDKLFEKSDNDSLIGLQNER